MEDIFNSAKFFPKYKVVLKPFMATVLHWII